MLAAQRAAPRRAEAGEVGHGHETTCRLRRTRDLLRNRAAIENIRSVSGDAFQSARQLGLADRFTFVQRRAIRVQEIPRQQGVASHCLDGVRNLIGEMRFDGEAVAGVADCRLHHRRERQCAVAAQRSRQAGNLAGNGDRETAVAAQLGDHMPITHEHVARRSRGRDLAIVQRDGAPLTRRVDEHEPATADATGSGVHHPDSQRRCHRRIDGVAAALQHLDARRRGEAMLRGHHAVCTPSGGNGGRNYEEQEEQRLALCTLTHRLPSLNARTSLGKPTLRTWISSGS